MTTTAAPISRCPCVIAWAGRDSRSNLTHTMESLHDLRRWLLDNVKVFKGRADPAEVQARGHRPLQDLAGILVRESLQVRPMTQNLVGEIVLQPRMARVLEAATEDGQELRLEVDGVPELVPGTRKVKRWKHVTSVNLLAPQGLDWLDRVREADSDGSDDSELQEWRWQVQSRLSGRPVREHDAPQEGSMDRDPRVGDLPPGTYPVVDFQDGEPRESLMRRGYYDMAAAGLVPRNDRLGPLAVQRGRQVAPSTTGAVREAASHSQSQSTGALPSRMASQSAAPSVQQALAVAQEGTRVMMAEDRINVGEATRAASPQGIAVTSDVDVAVHEACAAGIFGYGLHHTLGERARQPLDTAGVREASAGQRSGRPAYINPLRPSDSYPDLQASLDVANRGVAEGIFKRPVGAPQQAGAPGSTTEDLVSQALFGGR